jgi:hypothetical protein
MMGFADFQPSRRRSPGLDPGVKPKVVETKPKKPSRSRRVTVDEDEPDLIAAK